MVIPMKAKVYHDLSEKELQDRLTELKSELFNLRFQMATGQNQNPMLIRECKRNIARVKTIIREREIKAAGV